MASRGTPVDKADAVKPDKSVRRRQPKVAVPSLRDRIDKCGWKSVFVSPHSMRVLSEGLARSRCLGLRGKQNPAHDRAKRTYQTGRQKRSHVTRLSDITPELCQFIESVFPKSILIV